MVKKKKRQSLHNSANDPRLNSFLLIERKVFRLRAAGCHLCQIMLPDIKLFTDGNRADWLGNFQSKWI